MPNLDQICRLKKKPPAVKVSAPNSTPMQLDTTFTNLHEAQNLESSTATKRQLTKKSQNPETPKKTCPTLNPITQYCINRF